MARNRILAEGTKAATLHLPAA